MLSRIATTRPVVVIEEPLCDPASPPRWDVREAAAGVTVLRPHTPVAEPGFADAQMAALQGLVACLATDGVESVPPLAGADVWLYTPLALPLVDALQPSALVYDCMDELSAFDHAPPALLERESELLQRADLVFTGGPSLYRAKRQRSSRAHCFPSSVDAAHFAQARPGALALDEPADQSGIAHPRLGFFGVIDERLDREVLAHLAQAHPEWQIVLLGPVVKIDPASLPLAPNLHFLGGKTYAELPAYLAGWDVCLLPFALNRATEFISPTKTLEYMAAERPIVSTPITDVAEPYGDIVYLGHGPEGFVAACERAMAAPAAERAARTRAMRGVLAETSWDATAQQMLSLLDTLPSRPLAAAPLRATVAA